MRNSCLGGLTRLMILLYIAFLVVYLVLRLIVGDDTWWVALLHNGVPFIFLPLPFLIVLALAMRARLLTAYLLLLLIIAGVWLVPLIYMTDDIPAPAQPPVEFITFNVYPQNQQIDRVIDWLLIQDADVVLLQEMSATAVDDLARMSERYPYEATEHLSRGHAIFSRYPISGVQQVDLGAGTPALRAGLLINNQNVVVYNVHLLMPLRETPHVRIPFVPDALLSYDETQRNAQFDALRNASSLESVPVIVAGDFNLSEFSPVYHTLEAQWTDVYRAVTPGFGATWADGMAEEVPDIFPTMLRLDYAWLTDGIQPLSASVGPSLGSDHLPLLFSVDISGS